MIDVLDKVVKLIDSRKLIIEVEIYEEIYEIRYDVFKKVWMVGNSEMFTDWQPFLICYIIQNLEKQIGQKNPQRLLSLHNSFVSLLESDARLLMTLVVWETLYL